tara:strand:- start:1832 stop:2869 length:1038 start_codon:yes stop_codon:yes gene_type:complete
VSLQNSINRFWYSPNRLQNGFSLALQPLAWLLQFVARKLRKSHTAAAEKLSVPIIVIGNIAVGGTGKTPVIIALAKALAANGHSPGVVSRGYGGSAPNYPLLLTDTTPVADSGDEPALILQALSMPVCVAPERVAAAKLLISKGCDVILSDDGLQHYKLARDVEIVVVDSTRQFGNNRTLPAGPLREPRTRLIEADCVISNGELAATLHAQQYAMQLQPLHWVEVASGNTVALKDFHLSDDSYAISGIGNPQRFFNTLLELGVDASTVALADHHNFQDQDLAPYSGKLLLMTAKDAIKCHNLCDKFDSSRWYFLAVEAQIDTAFYTMVEQRMARYTCQHGEFLES